jgi:hypothetical protein
MEVNVLAHVMDVVQVLYGDIPSVVYMVVVGDAL